MRDLVVTVPKRLWAEWLGEGDTAYEMMVSQPRPWEGKSEYGFCFGPGAKVPSVLSHDRREGTLSHDRREPPPRVYIVAHGRLRGYSPLVRVEMGPTRFGGHPEGFALVRRGGAVACTLPGPIPGFQGWRYRWWERDEEIPFPDWRTAGVS